jgi:hypothetical protein
MTNYLNHPLVLTGVALFFVFALCKILIRSGLLVPVRQGEAAPIIHKLLNFGFAIAALVTLCGFGLESWKLYRQIDLLVQAKRSIAAEVLSDISSLDERLVYTEQTLAQDDLVERRLDTIRQRIAPSLRSYLASGYEALMTEQKITTLRQLFNSSPLRTGAGHSELENLRRSGLDTESYQRFYDQLAEVKRVTEDVFHALASGVPADGRQSERATLQAGARLELALEYLEIESQYAYMLALQLLLDMAEPPHPVPLTASAQAVLGGLQRLEPRSLPRSRAEIDLLASKSFERRQAALATKASLLATAKQLVEERVAELEEVGLLRIEPNDTWNEVVGKAVTLRQLGRTSDSVAAFSRYADMFAATDPTADQYARTAQQFTVQMAGLGAEGGAYVFEIRPGSSAQEAGLTVGDIIVEYDSRPITGMDAFVEAAEAAQPAKTVQIVLLRLTDHREFHRFTRTVPGGSLGAGLMPI